ncbi:MAG TPA: ABC transporter substrate-binding protein, partial [Chloroflexia bacterium]|nr:ABC transporter substrate-binding protein [Chloroflexia bacterium]
MKVTRLSLALVLLLLLSACGGQAATPVSVPEQATATTGVAETPAAQATPEAGGGTAELLIGFAFITSGDNAVYGNSQKAAAELAIEEINAMSEGPKITPFFEDTAAKPDQAITVFQKFINDNKVHAIIGPTLSNEAKSSDPIAQTAGVPVLAVSNTAAGIVEMGDYIF